MVVAGVGDVSGDGLADLSGVETTCSGSDSGVRLSEGIVVSGLLSQPPRNRAIASKLTLTVL